MSRMRMGMGEPVFRVDYRVIYGDTDAGGVVYNAHYLRFLEIGRTEMMRTHVMPYSEIERLGLILPVTESYLRYKAPARYDDLITIAVCLAALDRFTCRFHYRITRRDRDRELLLTRGFTVHACVDRQGRLRPIPEELRDRMRPLCLAGQSPPAEPR